MGTKERILETALRLFSERGFEAVSVRDIAFEIGVKESALYRHFSSKQAVFDQLVEDYLAKSATFMGGIHAQPTGDLAYLAHSAEIYKQLTDEDFLRIGGSVFTDFLMQPDVLRFWRMVSIERLRNRSLAEMWKNHLFDEPIAYQTGLFGLLIQLGAVREVDPELLALEFFSPLLLLYLHALPFELDSDEFEYLMGFAQKHMQHFRDTYALR